MGWANLTEDNKQDLLRRRYIENVPVDTLAAEVNMQTVTLNRRLQELRKEAGLEKQQSPHVDTNGATNKSYREVNYPPVYLRSAIFDIETMDFGTGGVQSHLVCCSVLPLDAKKPYTMALKFGDTRNDLRLVKEVVEDLCQYDILIGHNITGYDLNWLYSRLMFHGDQKPPSWLMYDTYQAAKSMAVKVESKSLGALGSYFGVPGSKTRVFRTDWSFIDSPFEEEFNKAMKNIIYHCEQDVLLNRGVFYALWQYDNKRALRKTRW